MRVSNGSSHRNREQRESRPEWKSGRLEVPKLAGWLDLDSAEARRLQVWAERIISDIGEFRHRQKRRREGVRS